MCTTQWNPSTATFPLVNTATEGECQVYRNECQKLRKMLQEERVDPLKLMKLKVEMCCKPKLITIGGKSQRYWSIRAIQIEKCKGHLWSKGGLIDEDESK